MTPRKILVFGFSVTGAHPGYVETWQKAQGNGQSDLMVERVAIGGLQPDIGRHVVPAILAERAPDAVIYEIATPVLRAREATQDHVFNHIDTVNFLVGEAMRRGIRPGFLDFPRTDTHPERDWMVFMHRRLLEEYGVPHVVQNLVPESLLDEVHPNDDGRKIYAERFNELIDLIRRDAGNPPTVAVQSPRHYHSLTAADFMTPSELSVVDFEKRGFSTRLVEIPEMNTVHLRFGREIFVVGALSAMGPRTGNLRFMSGENVFTVGFYDHHCYYFRIGGRKFPGLLCDRVSIAQTRDIPKETPLKGEKSFEPRLAGLCQILSETENLDCDTGLDDYRKHLMLSDYNKRFS